MPFRHPVPMLSSSIHQVLFLHHTHTHPLGQGGVGEGGRGRRKVSHTHLTREGGKIRIWTERILEVGTPCTEYAQYVPALPLGSQPRAVSSVHTSAHAFFVFPWLDSRDLGTLGPWDIGTLGGIHEILGTWTWVPVPRLPWHFRPRKWMRGYHAAVPPLPFPFSLPSLPLPFPTLTPRTDRTAPLHAHPSKSQGPKFPEYGCWSHGPWSKVQGSLHYAAR